MQTHLCRSAPGVEKAGEMGHSTDIISAAHDARTGFGGDDSPLAEPTKALEPASRPDVLASFAAQPLPELATSRRPTPQPSHPRS